MRFESDWEKGLVSERFASQSALPDAATPWLTSSNGTCGTGAPVVPGAGLARQTMGRPVLLEGLGASARATVVPAPAGSGKTVLLRSWISEAGLVASPPRPTPCHT